MNLNQWVATNIGKVVLNPNTGSSPYHGIDGQCVNAASSYSVAIGGPELFGSGDDDTAYTIWQTYRNPFFQVIPGHSVQAGDICFVGPGNPAEHTGPAGHVYIAVSVSGTTIKSVDADYNGHPELTNQVHNTNNVVGVFRPRGAKNIMDEQTLLSNFFYIYGWQGFFGKPNAFDNGPGTAQALKQGAPLLGGDISTITQEMRDDQYGQAWKAQMTASFSGHVPGATVLKPGDYTVE